MPRLAFGRAPEGWFSDISRTFQLCIMTLHSIVQQKDDGIAAETYDKKEEAKNGKHRPTPPLLCATFELTSLNITLSISRS